jgi:hypothetical protein
VSSKEFLRDRRETLEDEFFHKLQSEQIARLREELDRKQTREELSKACGIADEAVLDHLISLGVTGTTMAAMSMVPLVWVAWADGEVQEAERKAVLQAAGERGIEDGSAAYQMLSSWLALKPAHDLYEAWQRYTRSLADTLVPAQRAQLKEQIVGLARKVGEAAGGFLGMRKMSKDEEQALSSIEAAFGS